MHACTCAKAIKAASLSRRPCMDSNIAASWQLSWASSLRSCRRAAHDIAVTGTAAGVEDKLAALLSCRKHPSICGFISDPTQLSGYERRIAMTCWLRLTTNARYSIAWCFHASMMGCCNLHAPRSHVQRFAALKSSAETDETHQQQKGGPGALI